MKKYDLSAIMRRACISTRSVQDVICDRVRCAMRDSDTCKISEAVGSSPRLWL